VTDGRVSIIVGAIDDPVVPEVAAEIERELGGLFGVGDDRSRRHPPQRAVERALVALRVHVELRLRREPITSDGPDASRLGRARNLRGFVPPALKSCELDLRHVERRMLGAPERQDSECNQAKRHGRVSTELVETYQTALSRGR
jgi:hypothetical protein